MAARPPAPVVLVGSSLGAFVAWHVAARERIRADALRPVTHLVLLAPALDFGAEPIEGFSARTACASGVRRTGRSSSTTRSTSRAGSTYALFEDARRYDSASAQVFTPGLVFQGTRDWSVDPEMVAAFVAERPTLTLQLVDDDHQLLSSLDTISEQTAIFLGLRRPSAP